MAHEITVRSNGTAEAFYGSNTPAWHELGTVIEGLATSGEAIKHASLDWDVEQQDLSRTTNTGRELVATHVANVRADTNECLGIVGATYKVVQNRDAFNFMDAIVGDRLAMFDSAGSLFGGKRVWMLAKIPKEYFVGEDRWQPYVLLVNGHDGLMGLRIIPTAVRVVCNNTLTAALSAAEQTRVGCVLKHTKNIADRVTDVRNAMGMLVARFDAMDAAFHRFIETPITDKIARDYFDRTTTTPRAGVIDERVEAEDDAKARPTVDLLMNLYRDDPLQGVGQMRGTVWAAMNAVTQWVDHIRPDADEPEQRMAQAMLAVGATIKQRAYKNALALVG